MAFSAVADDFLVLNNFVTSIVTALFLCINNSLLPGEACPTEWVGALRQVSLLFFWKEAPSSYPFEPTKSPLIWYFLYFQGGIINAIPQKRYETKFLLHTLKTAIQNKKQNSVAQEKEHKSFSNNQIQLSGNVGKNIQLHYTDSGAARLSFTLASHIRREPDSGKNAENRDWHYIVVWGEQAEMLYGQMSVGDFIRLKGRITYKKYPGQDGKMATNTVIIAHEVVPVSSGPKWYETIYQDQKIKTAWNMTLNDCLVHS